MYRTGLTCVDMNEWMIIIISSQTHLLKNGIEVLESFLILDFGYDLDVLPLLTQSRANEIDVRWLANKRSGDEIHAMGNTEVDEVIAVLRRACWEVNDATWQIHVLFVTK